MKNLSLAIALAFLITGCTPCENELHVQTRCIEGVEYIFIREDAGRKQWWYFSAKFKPDGTVATCE